VPDLCQAVIAGLRILDVRSLDIATTASTDIPRLIIKVSFALSLKNSELKLLFFV